MKFYISTIAADAQAEAVRHGFGLEIAEFCTAYNMDEHFSETDPIVQKKLSGISKRILHAPFNELFPCAVDPKAKELAAQRYRQAITLAQRYGAAKVVIHGGYNPWIYYPCWYAEQSILFWKEFLKDAPENIEICLENVLEEEPGMLLDIVKAVNDPRLWICLDIGHVNAYSSVPVTEWLEDCAPYIHHFHIHNNRGKSDTHSALPDGTIPMAALLENAQRLCPDASCTLEVAHADDSVRWILEEHVWKQC